MYQKRRSRINNYRFYIKRLEKEKQSKPSVPRRKEIIWEKKINERYI